MRLLVIEDEFKLGEYLKKGLDENGYTTELARNGLDGQFRALQGDHDLVVLDVGLPGIDGFSILKSLRQRRKTPVLMLTARDRVEDRVRGLHEGADDYLVKPFAFPELLARVRALLRRSGPAQAETGLPKIADLELDLVRRRAFRGRQQLLLTSKEFALLALLVRRNGEILARTTIAEQVWDMNFDSDTNYVEVAVRRLRAKLDDPFTHKLLHTVRGMGYVLEDRS
ncbi:MAG: heavy metal response regulator transcription factor [Burkholderiaceae bacterium]|nr:heavy metal response regulator transcription factor [Pseudomonadota bacterium]MDO8276532.1 heavy metal response regulator transcription factor [Burkholderiaceae bacterium]MDP3137744.1 heavy metal response regulator transcription factor [Burkholderiaceae bacterium]